MPRFFAVADFQLHRTNEKRRRWLYHQKAKFSLVDGVKIGGNPDVQVRVGSVASLELDPTDYLVQMTMNINHGIQTATAMPLP